MRFEFGSLGAVACVVVGGVAGAQTSTGPDAGKSREEVIVTGTHIRNTDPVAPVLVYTQEDFDKAGAATAQEFMALLPQNFGGSQSADTSGDALDGLAFDPGMGSSINLRGVGSESTLVLVDGRRLAAAGIGDYTDISMIPLAAVERIEVMVDGASALYGSDAIGGVVNFIMRKDFSGAETRLRYGESTQGGASQQQLSQVLGTRWNSGGAVLSYDYLDQAALSREDRDFSANAPGARNGPKALLPGEERHGASLFARQELSNRITASANAIYSQRDGQRWDWENGFVQQTDVTRKQYGGAVGLAVELGESWHAQVNGSYDEGTVYRKTIQNPTTGGNFVWDSTYDLWSTDLLVSGDLIPLPWGAVKLAAGAAYREEALEYRTFRNGAGVAVLETETLQVKSGYAELSIPLGEQGDRPHAPLTVSLAGRYEDYSTFGSNFDPTYRLRWTPIGALSMYATYGTSFRAPNLFQFQQNPFFNTSISTNRLPGFARGLVLSGNSNDLQEQTAQTLTAGLEFNLPVGSGLRARVNYFDIDYDDRIQGVDVSPVAVLTTPAYQTLVTRRGDIPDAEFNALIAQNLSGADARVLGCTVPLSPAGACGMSPALFGVLVDLRLQNFASVDVNGVDLTLSQDVTWGSDRLNFTLDASYFLTFEQQLNPASAAHDILNTLYNPVDLRLRGSASWSRLRWGSTLSVNHTAGYSTAGAVLRIDDATPMPVAGVASWTTFDWVLSYSVADESTRSWLDGLGISLSVLNVLDKDPPYVEDQFYGFGYDPSNADPRGRMVSLTVSKRW
jgi:iron complex outermembrane recepter protein